VARIGTDQDSVEGECWKGKVFKLDSRYVIE
jgi:hypothetical protein